MSIRKIKSMTNGQRGMSVASFDELTKGAVAPKALLTTKKRSGGRNAQGKITVRHIGGGNKIKLRKIDFKRNKDDIMATVDSIQYDPNRSAYIALLVYADGEKRFILAPKNLKVGDKVMSGNDSDIKIGNNMAISKMPVGSIIHNIEMNPGKGGQLVRSAGLGAQIMAREERYCTLRLPSGEMRKVLGVCRATLGEVGNSEHEILSVGKAGKNRHRGIKPTVRGSAMNPVDHPHGGGEGKSPVGHAGPMTPWGKPALGHKTRGKKPSDKLIVKRRK